MNATTMFDIQLARLANFGCELDNGFTSHLPMVIDALRVVRRPEAIEAWLDENIKRALPRPVPGQAIDSSQWREALADGARFSDWAKFFAGEIDARGWRETVETWCSQLSSGFAAGATHGVIRTAHAVRMLLGTDTPERRRELADALASWTTQYVELPIQRLPVTGSKQPLDALASLPRVPEAARRNDGAITVALAQIALVPELNIAMADVDLDVSDAPVELARAFARLFLVEVDSPHLAVVLTHAITSAAAVRNLLPVLSPESARQLIEDCWRVGCALTATYARREPDALLSIEEKQPLASASELIDRCIASGDDHAIKLTEACLSFFAVSNDSAFLAAASLGCDQLID